MRECCAKNHRILITVSSLFALVTCATLVLHETRVGKLQNEIVQIKLGHKYDMEKIGQEFTKMKANCLPGKAAHSLIRWIVLLHG